MNKHLDSWLLVPTLLLLSLSGLMVFSTTAVISEEFYSSSTTMLKKHVIHIILGLFVMYLFYKLPLEFFRKIANPLLLFTMLLLLLVLVTSLGSSAGGAKRWLMLGPLRVQPGELSKLSVILFIGFYIEKHLELMKTYKYGVVIPLAVVGVVAVLLLLEPDFGSTSIIIGVVLIQLFPVVRIKHMILTSLMALGAIALLIVSAPYRMKRLNSFLDPFADPSGSGYQLIQSLIAVGSGGASGAGLGASKQKLFYLPAAHTDFIFSVIAEELGLIGVTLILVLFVIIGVRGMLLAKAFQNKPELASLTLGCTFLIVLPAMLNMGVATGLLPTKGLVLPFIAYGGTAMIVNLSVMGLLLSFSNKVREE